MATIEQRDRYRTRPPRRRVVENESGTWYRELMMSRFRSRDYWRPLDAIFARLPDVGHPLTERFAIDMHGHDDSGAKRTVWEKEVLEVREHFRDRARRLMMGDLSVVPMKVPPAYGAWQAVLVLPSGRWIDAPPSIDDWR